MPSPASVSATLLLTALCAIPAAWAQTGIASGQDGSAHAVADSVRTRTAVPRLSTAKKTTARPDFRNLRFEEVWPASARTTHWDDAIKAIPIGAHADLTLGGQVRAREEFAHDFNFTNVSDTYGQSRTLIDADLQAGDPRRLHGRVFGEFRDAQSFNRDLPGGTRASDGDRSDLQNLFADVGFARSWVRYGRQEVVTNRERLIGVPDWSNTRRGFQGTRAMLVLGSLAIDALDARPVVVRLNAPDLADSTTRFRTLSLGSAPNARALAIGLPATWQAFYYDQQITAATPTHRKTAGGRAAWTLAGAAKNSETFGFESEAAIQHGAVGAKEIRAWFWTAEVTTQWRAVRGAPSLALGLEEASGDANATDNTLGAFNTLYSAAHGHGGYADVFGRANARETHLISTWDPFRRLNLRGAWYRYDRLRLSDGVYNKQNVLLRAALGATARHAGDEVDLTTNVIATRHLKFVAGYSWILPGAFLRQTTGGAHDSRWGFLGSTFTF